MAAQGGEGGGSTEGASGVAEPLPPFRDDDRQLVVYRARLGGATGEQRAALRAVLEAILGALA